jgi:hypothetical protein
MKPVQFEEKDPEEAVVLTFDFGPDLAGDTISPPPVVSVTTYAGTDADPSAILSGAAQLDVAQTKVLQKVMAGAVGASYRVKVKVNTAGGRTLVLARILPVDNA